MQLRIKKIRPPLLYAIGYNFQNRYKISLGYETLIPGSFKICKRFFFNGHVVFNGLLYLQRNIQVEVVSLPILQTTGLLVNF